MADTSIKILADREDIVAIANAVRNKLEATAEMTLGEIARNIGSIGAGGIDTSDATATAETIFKDETAYVDGEKVVGTFTIDSELTMQDDLITQIQTVLEGKIAGGATLPMLENSASASEVFENKEFIDANGEKVVGTFTIDGELSAQDNLISQIVASLKNKSTGNVDIDEELSVQDDLIVQIQTALNNKINGAHKEA